MAQDDKESAKMSKTVKLPDQLHVPAQGPNPMVQGKPTPGAPVPPQTNVAPASGNWMDQAVNYLTNKGWVMVGGNEQGVCLWNDPSSKIRTGEVKPGAKIPISGGGFEVVNQYHAPVGAWDYTTEQALMIQRQRDMVPAASVQRQEEG